MTPLDNICVDVDISHVSIWIPIIICMSLFIDAPVIGLVPLNLKHGGQMAMQCQVCLQVPPAC